MKIGDIKNPIMAVLHDAHQAEIYLDENPDSQFARRTYIRSTFAAIEGCIWILKMVCLNSKPINGIRTMSVAEFALLKEESYELKNNGEVSTSPKFLKLADNVKFTFKAINKGFKAEIDLEVGGAKWNYFLQAITIRNRITHPKNTKEIDIGENEIELCKEVISWFNTLIASCFDAFVKSSNYKDPKQP
jgi:hypothetical protein